MTSYSILDPSGAHETQESICEWAAEAFGTAGSDLRVAGRTNEEMAELIRAVTSEAPQEDILEEAADVLIVLSRLGQRIGCELSLSENAGVLASCESPLNIVVRANYRLAILIETLAFGGEKRLTLFSVWSHLLELIYSMGSTPELVVDAKMAKNRKRVWQRDGTGHGYHVRDKSRAP